MESDRSLQPMRNVLAVDKDTPLSQCPTNLDASDPRQRALIFASGNPADIEFDSRGIAMVCATHWLVFPDEGVDPETGEVSLFGRLVLFQRDGRFFRTSSAYAPRRLRAALELFGPCDWARGIKFVITRRTGKRCRAYHDIRVAVDEQFQEPADE